jgi:hypothetical protein
VVLGEGVSSTGFMHRLDRLKPRASQFRGPPDKVYNIFNTVHDIGEILLKLALNTNQSINIIVYYNTISVCVILLLRMSSELVKKLQSVPITTKVVSSNPAHGEVYWMQHYVIKFFSDLRQVGGFLRVLRFPPPIKLNMISTIEK